MVPVYGRRREPIESHQPLRWCAFHHVDDSAAASRGRREISVTPPDDDQLVTTQLRLVDPPEGPAVPASRAAKRSRSAAPRQTGTRTSGPRVASRRAVRWGDWQLDARTRTVGRQGVAAAREALERVAAEQERARAGREAGSQRLAS